MKDFLISLLVAIVGTAGSYGIGIHFGWLLPKDFSWLEASSVFFQYSCVYLCVKQKRLNYPIGIIGSILLAALFVKLELYASMFMSIYLVPVLFLGWRDWKKQDDTNTPPSYTKMREVPKLLAMTAGTFILMYTIDTWMGGVLTPFDCGIVAATILGQYLLNARKMENWIVWVVVNVLSIYTYASAGGYVLAMQYVVFLFNTAYGYYCWKKDVK